MKPILIHIHIYYPDLWPELKICLQNIIKHQAKILITMVEPHLAIQADIKQSFPDAQIKIIENKGYDIGPFIYILNQINLDDFSYVIKMHTKRDMPVGARLNYFNVSASLWREYALSPFKTEAAFKQCLNSFSSDLSLGMVSNYHLILSNSQDDKTARRKTLEFLEKTGISVKKYTFVAGTMFMCRAELLKPLQVLNLTLKSFDEPDKKHHTTSFAHIVERLFGVFVLTAGYNIKDVITSRQYNGKLAEACRRIMKFIYYKKSNRHGKITVKICKISLPSFFITQ